MFDSDTSNLLMMRQMVRTSTLRGDPLAACVEKLLEARDSLTFIDEDWYDVLTEHIVTLDSATTFEPRDEAERAQFDAAIINAIDAIRSLIKEKLL